MRGLRAAGSIRANSPKLKNHRLGRWIFINGEDVGFSFVLNVQLLRQNTYRIPFITVYINICTFCTNKFKTFAHSSRFSRSSESSLPNWRALARTRYFLYSSGIGVEMFFNKGWIPAFLGEGYASLIR